MNKNHPIPIVIAGPTGSGKSSYAVKLAQKIGGAIICADSRQVYKRMVVGAAGPTETDIQEVPHYGYNSIDPKIAFDAAKFVKFADKLIIQARAAGFVPILVGGTGLYLRAWRYGLPEEIKKDPIIRRQIERRIDEEGAGILHRELGEIDPVSAHHIDPNDHIRIARALEIHAVTGKRPSDIRQGFFTQVPRVEADWRLILPERDVVWKRVARRAAQMYEDGLVEEAIKLQTYLGVDHPLCKTMGYEEALSLASNEMDAEEALERTIIRHRQYAKRQRTWFQKENWWTPVVVANAGSHPAQ